MQINSTLEKLKDALDYAQENSRFYRDLFEEYSIDLTSFSPDSFERIPFTQKSDLTARNQDFLAIEESSVFDITTTSGTTGEPISFYLSRNDVNRLATNEAGSLSLAGASNEDRFQLMTTMNRQFMAGLAYYEGIKKLGAGIVRTGPGSLKSQWEAILKYKPTYLIAIPSFIPSLIAEAKKLNINYQQTSVKAIVCIGEPIRTPELQPNTLHKRITDNWEVQLYSTYASTEMSTAYTECFAQNGCHEQSELIYTEVVDEEGNQVQEGESGEVVVTTLGVEAMPLIRYKTGDICHVYRTACSCKRTSLRLGPVIGRKDHRIKYKGTTLYPRSLQNFLTHENIWPYVITILTDHEGNDLVELLCDLNTDQTKLLDAFKHNFSVTPQIRKVSSDKINHLIYGKNLRKPQLVIDARSNQKAKDLISNL